MLTIRGEIASEHKPMSVLSPFTFHDGNRGMVRLAITMRVGPY